MASLADREAVRRVAEETSSIRTLKGLIKTLDRANEQLIFMLSFKRDPRSTAEDSCSALAREIRENVILAEHILDKVRRIVAGEAEDGKTI